ncbi:hypothetical protein [Bordetella sp. LUAb4]|uniref:hypothetical protein n=1 Tax=Bordetella sp. LUAb4 TaxID=2843195 RepID=UPI001E2A2886|nr:hypothetical protein [Bordetella sp. LUAb4]
MYKRIVSQLLALTCTVWLGSAPAVAENTANTKANLVSGAQQSRDQWGAHIVGLSRTLFDGKVVSKANCANEPAYTCTGLMLSAFEPQDTDYWFSPNPSGGKLSMSYVIKATSRGSNAAMFAGSGYILWPSSTLATELAQRGLKNNAFPTIYRCGFAQDAYTDNRTDKGCGTYTVNGSALKNTGPCQAQGITTAAQWLAAYGNGDLMTQQCGFILQISPAADKQAFGVVEQIQNTLLDRNTTSSVGSYNEIVLQAWPELEPSRVPLLAFFYVEPNSARKLIAPVSREGKKGRQVLLNPAGSLYISQVEQLNYYKKAKVFAPIIRLSGNSWDQLRMSYIDTDQSPGIPSTVTVLPQ